MEHVSTIYAVVSPWGGEVADKIHPFPKDSMYLYGVGGMLSVNLLGSSFQAMCQRWKFPFSLNEPASDFLDII